jgi:hypothetical protein
MEIKPIPVAAFARFYESSSLNKVVRARNAHLMVTDPEAYRIRDHYLDLRNTLAKTHWKTGEIADFEKALGPLVNEQADSRKGEHYLMAGEAYVDFWKKQEAEYFKVPSSDIRIAGLPIEVTTEVGMRRRGESFALKLWFNAGKPTRQFRQAVYYMTDRVRNGGWREDWRLGVWDLRRQVILMPTPLPREFGLALEGQAAAFRQIWSRLEAE